MLLFAWLLAILFVLGFADLPDNDHSSVSWLPTFPPQVPELYALAENFNKESKKSNRLKVLGISPGESQKILDAHLKTVSFTSGSNLREAPQPVFTWKVVRKDEEKPVSMTELLHRSLLTGSLSQIDKLWKSQQRLARYGIPPPSHTFPYDILLDGTTYSATAWKKTSRPRKLSKLGITHIKPEKFIFEDRISEYLLVEPGTRNR